MPAGGFSDAELAAYHARMDALHKADAQAHGGPVTRWTSHEGRAFRVQVTLAPRRREEPVTRVTKDLIGVPLDEAIRRATA